MTLAVFEGSRAPFCYINGKRHELPKGRAEATLLQYLRESGLTGTKLGCGEGGCGACTVMLSHYEDGRVVHRAANACLCPLYSVDGMHVVTVEGIGNARDGLHPVQERLSKAHGSQCGFCTPGFVMSMYALLRSAKAPPTLADIEECISGNLCRCTGYRPILDAFRTFVKADPAAYSEEAIAASKAAAGSAAAGSTANGHHHGSGGGSSSSSSSSSSSKPVCATTGLPCDCKAFGTKGCGAEGCCMVGGGSGDCANGGALPPQRPSAEPIFPPELKKLPLPPLHVPGALCDWYRPVSLAQLLALRRALPAAKLVVGNTEVGIEMKFKDAGYRALISATSVPELCGIDVTDAGIEVGASVTLSRLRAALQALVASRPPHETAGLRAVVSQLHWFAGLQIRNMASLGGNIVTGSPISDLNPLWMACGAVFTVVGDGDGGAALRRVPASRFFLSYRKVDLAPHEVLASVFIPFTLPLEYVKEFKQSPRREDDIAIVNAGFRVRLAPAPAAAANGDGGGGGGSGFVVEEAALAFGGVAPTAVLAHRTAAAMVGRPLDQATLGAALEVLKAEVAIADNAPGGRVEYRRALTCSFLFKLFVHLGSVLESDPDAQAALAAASGSSAAAGPSSNGSSSSSAAYRSPFPAEVRSAGQEYHRPPSHGVQLTHPEPEPPLLAGAAPRHMAADMQVTGEAVYTDDTPLPAGTLHAALVASTIPHGRILSVDPSAALALPGVAGYFGARDVPGDNTIGPVRHDEECFASEFVTCVGAPIGVVVADTEALARRAAKLVKVTYEPLPAVMSIEEALAAGSFFADSDVSIVSGDAAAAWPGCDHVLEGRLRLGGQEHFYLEPNNCIVVPADAGGEYLLISSTQAPMKNQKFMARVLGLSQHKVVCKAKRLGGGFGGKETRAVFVSCAAAVPAYHLRRPVRLCLDRDEDMQMTGQRHAFVADYKVGFMSDGRLVALDLQMYNNAGNSLDLSLAVMSRALLHADGCYRIPHMDVRGKLCFTHQASNTAFRGFGGPQGLTVTEMIVERVATELGLPAWKVRELNLYREGDVCHFGQRLELCHLRACWDEAMRSSGFSDRQRQVDAFNAAHRYRKRGLAIMPTKFGISFTVKFMNQAGALVHVYTDGSVLVSHGGVEMGQGLHTKMCQVTAQALGLPLSSVHVSETATDKVPNATPTAASASSDLYGAAILDACRQLNDRLAPYRAKLGPGAAFKDVANAAYLDRVDLSAHGFFATEDITGGGGNKPFNYFVFGAAVTEVELDTLTGDASVVRADVVMDIGNPINPAIDVGQIEGAFMQGFGWTCLEELQWGDAQHPWVRPGQLFTRGPGTYKIPTANDIPLDLRVTLLQNTPNPRAIHSSKAVGEPPFHLGACTWFALRNAVAAARADAGLSGWFDMDSPATCERLRMLCADDILRDTLCVPDDYKAKISC